MKPGYSRRDFLRLGLALPVGLAGCGDDPAFGTGGRTETPPPPAADGYKALVCVFLHGGNDAYGTVVPLGGPMYERYAAARLNLAIPSQALQPLNGTAPDGARYGVPAAAAPLRQLFNAGRAAIVGNVGSLAQPVTRADYLAERGLPERLFSHNDQSDQWQTALADAAPGGLHGWAGRMADVLSGANGGAELPMNISIAGANVLQRGRNSSPLSMGPGGPQELTWPPDGRLRDRYDALRALPASDPYARTYAQLHERALRLNLLLQRALRDAPELATVFPGTHLGSQLRMVARLIGVRAAAGVRRQVFFVAAGGFDTHDAQETVHGARLEELSQALAAFDQATVELGVDDSVTAFTASDFGRSLSTNGKGTDHGWSSHQFVVGGAVRGGAFYGGMPSLLPGSGDDTVGGRFIPSVAVDEYAATLARWFGVSDSGLDDVLPNLHRFATRGLAFV